EVLLKEIPALSQVVLVDTIGKEKIKLSRYHHFTSKELGDVSSKKAFAAALGGRNYSGKVYIVEAEPYFELAIPVVSEKKVIGVVLAELNLKYFWDLLSDFKVGEKGITYLIDEEGRIIAHPDLSLVFKRTKTSYPHFQTEGSEAGIFVPYENVSGIRVVGSCVIIEGLGWYVVAEQPLSEVYHELNMMKLNISLLLFTTALVAIFFGVLYSKKIVEPIKLLQSGVSKVSGGNFTPRLEIKTGDELEDLAKDFNLMAKNLKQSYEDLQTYEGHLEQAVKEKTKELSITTDELKQKADEMSVLLDILKTVTSTLELEELLPVVLKKVVSLFGMQAGGVFLIDETSLTRCAEVHKCKMTKCAAFKSESLKCWAIPHTLCRKEISGKFKEKMERCKECPVFKSINLRLEAVVGASIPTGITVNIAESLCEKALYELKKPTIFSYDELIRQKTKSIFSDYMKVESQIFLPLVEWTHEDVSGIITLISSRERFYTSAEINLLSNVADYLALAIYRVKLFEKTKRSAVESRSLYEISKILGSTLNLKALLNLAVNFAMGILHGDVASVMLLDEEKQELTIKASIGLSESVISKARVKVGEGIAGWVARAGEPLWISDVSQDKRFKHLKPREKLMAAVCVPFKVKEKILGVLSVGSYYPQRFLESDLRMVSTLAGQAAVAVNNAQLFYQLEELYFTTIKAFVRAIEAKDPYTRGHSERVTLNAIAIAKEMNLSDEEVEVIEAAGLLHDIGKMGVKEEILNKPSILTKEEYDLVKLHPLIASKIMEGIPRLGKV
ncbi:MAG: GAF domain-containing protein, partial [Candidatus Subteraquimicrobiales bacterium]|nr:GAF domain-containing protein [Candidatus Subteraquimicrobiales bacterium]